MVNLIKFRKLLGDKSEWVRGRWLVFKDMHHHGGAYRLRKERPCLKLLDCGLYAWELQNGKVYIGQLG